MPRIVQTPSGDIVEFVEPRSNIDELRRVTYYRQSLHTILVEDIIFFVIKHRDSRALQGRIEKHNLTGNILNDPDENF